MHHEVREVKIRVDRDIQAREASELLQSRPGLHTSVEDLSGDSRNPVNASSSLLSSRESRFGNQELVASGRSAQSSGILRVMTEFYTARKCGTTVCTCRCHEVQRVSVLPWASSLIGSLFIGYSGLPLPLVSRVACTEKACEKKENSLIKVAWYFPSWFPLAGKMISVIDKWTPLDGHDISIKLPRVVSSASDIFIFAQKGHIDGIQQLISQKKASVYDISAGKGRSALHVRSTPFKPVSEQFLIDIVRSHG